MLRLTPSLLRKSSSSRAAQWSFQVSKGWAPITSSSSNATLNALRANHTPGNASPSTVTMNGVTYAIDLDAMTQTNQQTGRVRKLKVEDIASSSVSWKSRKQSPTSSANGSPSAPAAKKAPPQRRQKVLLDDVIKAAQTNDAAELDKLIQRDGNVHGTADKDGNYPIYYAARHGAADSLAVLLKAGANPDYVNVFGETAAVIAASRNDIATLTVLQQTGVNLDQRDTSGANPVLIAALNGSLDVVKYLGGVGVDMSVATPMGVTVAMYVACMNDGEALKFVLSKHPALATQASLDGSTPLSVAVMTNAAESVRVLCDHGADPLATVKGESSRTVQQLAAAIGSVECLVALQNKKAHRPVRVLPKRWSNVSLAFIHVTTADLPYRLLASPLILAVRMNNVPLVEHLVRRKGTTKPTISVVKHAAVAAAHHGHLDCLQAIAGGRPLAIARVARRAYNVGVAAGHADVGKVLQRWYTPPPAQPSTPPPPTTPPAQPTPLPAQSSTAAPPPPSTPPAA